MNEPTPIPFSEVLQALLDENQPFQARYLYRLSDLVKEEFDELQQTWPRLGLRRRQALLEDIEQFGEDDPMLGFTEVCYLGLVDADPQVRMHAVHTLGNYEEVEFLDDFLDMLTSDPDDSVRAACASALGPMVFMGEVEELEPEVLSTIEQALLGAAQGSGAKLLRRRAVEALGFSSRPEVIGLIEEAYASGDEDWLITALFAMGRSYHERWNASILASLQDQRGLVRAEAAQAAGEVQLASARERLLEMLDDDEDEARLASIWSLSEIGGEGVLEALEDRLENCDDEDEIDMLEAALENLAYNDEILSFDLLDIDEEADETAAASGTDDEDVEEFDEDEDQDNPA